MFGLNLAGVDGDPHSQTVNQGAYREAVGSLMFLMVCTRSNIAFAVGQVTRFSYDPMKARMAAVQRIFGYLKGTLDFGLTYRPNNCPNTLTAFSD